jgi:hypothetical protein
MKFMLRLTKFISGLEEGVEFIDINTYKRLRKRKQQLYHAISIYNFDLREKDPKYVSTISPTLVVYILETTLPLLVSNDDYGKMDPKKQLLYTNNNDQATKQDFQWRLIQFVHFMVGGKNKSTRRHHRRHLNHNKTRNHRLK